MADSDYLKYLQNPAGTTDPYATNPFAEGAPTDGTGLTPFAGEDIAPFRFTQNALNPTTQATGGFAGRTEVARSPFTSGQEYQALRGIRSELEKMGNVQDPGAAPIMPAELAPQPVQEQETRHIAPMEAATTEAQGLPTLSYDLPSNIVLNGMNPIYAAQKFAEYKDKLTPEQLSGLGPMTQVSGYDVKGMIGEEEYNKWFGGQTYQGDKNRASQTFFKNLSLLPSTIDPGFGLTRNETNLATRDFSYNPYTTQSREDMMKAANMESTMGGDKVWVSTGGGDEERGYWRDPVSLYNPETDPIKALGDSGLYFNPAGGEGTAGTMNLDEFTANVNKDLTNEQHNKNQLVRGVQAALPGVTIGLMSYGLGAAAAPLFGAAGAAAGTGAGATTAAGTTAAGGLAGMAGMSAGIGATAVNAGATMAASYGAQQLAAELGVPMDSPLVQMLIPAIMGGASGLASGGFGGGSELGDGGAGGLPGGEVVDLGNMEQIQSQVMQRASDLGVDPDTYVNSISNGTVQNLNDYLQRSQQYFNTISSGSSGASSVKNDLTKTGFQKGMQVLGSPNANANAGGIPYDQQMSQYNTDMSKYNTDLESYNAAVAEWQRKQELASQYEQKMAEYEAKVGLYSNAQGLRGKQASMMSQIQGNLAENPFYDSPENYSGIQTLFV